MRFPECFPDNFSEEILPKEAKEEKLPVYRIAKSGIIDRNAFISTYEETKLGLRPIPKNWNLDDPGIYSTSCFEVYDHANELLNIFMRHYPQPIIAFGSTESSCGPHQRTSEREKVRYSHIDWWIYQESVPQIYFKKV